MNDTVPNLLNYRKWWQWTGAGQHVCLQVPVASFCNVLCIVLAISFMSQPMLFSDTSVLHCSSFIICRWLSLLPSCLHFPLPIRVFALLCHTAGVGRGRGSPGQNRVGCLCFAPHPPPRILEKKNTFFLGGGVSNIAVAKCVIEREEGLRMKSCCPTDVKSPYWHRSKKKKWAEYKESQRTCF